MLYLDRFGFSGLTANVFESPRHTCFYMGKKIDLVRSPLKTNMHIHEYIVMHDIYRSPQSLWFHRSNMSLWSVWEYIVSDGMISSNMNTLKVCEISDKCCNYSFALFFLNELL